MLLVRRGFIALLLLCLGCIAQSVDQDVTQRVERQVRAYYNIPAGVQITLGKREPSDFPNYDKVTLTFTDGPRKQTHEFLLSKDNKTLVRFTKLDLTKDPYADVMKKIDVNDRPVRGNKDAKVTIVNYDDFECPFCARMHETMFPGVFDQYKDKVRVIYKDYPLIEIHPWAMHASVNANCLAAQSDAAYWDFADYVHGHRNDINGDQKTPLAQQFNNLDQVALQQGQKHNLDQAKLQACVKAQNTDAVRASMHEADGLGVNATPTMFINGQKLDGAVPPQELRATLDRALLDAGVQPPARPTPAAQPVPAAPPKPAKAANPTGK
ncbi:MAG TPA: thioredoxin domain-containing protein [Terriglobales bacterium]|nr:thioredoxin domain-containing protein [Terriglobales bacterium]